MKTNKTKKQFNSLVEKMRDLATKSTDHDTEDDVLINTWSGGDEYNDRWYSFSMLLCGSIATMIIKPTKPILKMKTLFFDIETNAIEDWSNLSDLHTVHCLSIYDPTTPKMITYHGAGIQNGLQELAKADRIVGHNVIGFDLPALSKMYSFHPPLIKVLDTMVMAKCIVADVRNDDFLRNKFDKSLLVVTH